MSSRTYRDGELRLKGPGKGDTWPNQLTLRHAEPVNDFTPTLHHSPALSWYSDHSASGPLHVLSPLAGVVLPQTAHTWILPLLLKPLPPRVVKVLHCTRHNLWKILLTYFTKADCQGPDNRGQDGSAQKWTSLQDLRDAFWFGLS